MFKVILKYTSTIYMKTIKYKFIALIIAGYGLISNSALGQVVPSSSDSASTDVTQYIKTIAGGKHRIYFNFDYSLTNPACASIYRESRFDEDNMLFDGPFKDYRTDGNVIAEGFYKEGYLDSTLVVRYLNGNIWQKGSYKDSKMQGVWEYFFPDGKPMYTINIKKDKVYLTHVWDIDGQVLVKNGKGKATIYHYGSNSVIKKDVLHWGGKVRKGLMQGVWMPYKYQSPVNIKQIYVNGRFVNGFDNEVFYNTVNLFSLEQQQALINAEELSVAVCDLNPTNDSPPIYPTGDYYLSQDLYKEIDKVLGVFPRTALVEVSFDVNVDGSLSDLKGESETGVEQALIESLKRLGPWLPATKAYAPVTQRKTFTLYYLDKNIRKYGNDYYERLDRYREPVDQFRNDPKPKPEQWKKIQ